MNRFFVMFAMILTILKLLEVIAISWWLIVLCFFGGIIIGIVASIIFPLLLIVGLAFATFFVGIADSFLKSWENASRNRRRKYLKTNEGRRRNGK